MTELKYNELFYLGAATIADRTKRPMMLVVDTDKRCWHEGWSGDDVLIGTDEEALVLVKLPAEMRDADKYVKVTRRQVIVLAIPWCLEMDEDEYVPVNSPSDADAKFYAGLVAQSGDESF